MRLWTIQPLEVWTQLRASGELRVEPERLRNQYVPAQYRWLQRRLGWQSLPWWAYCAKPDLRRHRWGAGLRQGKEQHVRLELEVSDAVTFPIWAWDTVYAGGYLALSLEEKIAWEKRLEAIPELEDVWPLPEPLRAELEASWERILLELPSTCLWRGSGASMLENTTDLEAVYEVLSFSDVRHARIFTKPLTKAK